MSKRGSLDIIDIVLIAEIVLTAYAAFFVPLPRDLTAPGFSSFILFQAPEFLLAYTSCLLGMGVLWWRKGEQRFTSAFLVTIFSLMTMGLWGVMRPGGDFLFSGDYYGSLANQFMSSGHAFLQGWGLYPAFFVLATSTGDVLALKLITLFSFLDGFGVVFEGLFYFLIIDLFLKSPKLSSLGTMLAIIADSELIKVNEFPPFYGYLFFSLLGYLMLRFVFNPTKNGIISFSVASLSSVLFYPGTPFTIVLMTIGAVFTRDRGASFGRTMSLTMIPLIPWTAWFVYVNDFSYGQYFWNTLTSIILRHQIQSSGFASFHPFGFYLVQLLSSNLTSLPYDLGFLLPIWFLMFFGLGIVMWIVTKVIHRPATPPTFILGSLMSYAALLIVLQYPTGTGWTRVTPLIAPFVAVVFISVLRHRKRSLFVIRDHEPSRFVALMCCVLILTLPTVVAYTPTEGSQYATYQWGFQAGSYISSHSAFSNIYIGSGVWTLNYTLLTRIVPAFDPAGGLSPTQAQLELSGQLRNYISSHGESVLAVSPMLYPAWAHLYGEESESYVITLIGNLTSASNIIYSNGYTSLFEE